MQLKDFDFTLPEHLIADRPLPNRTDSRLLHVDRQTHTNTHRTFADILDFFAPGDLLVVNNTKVMPARCFAKKQTGGRVEIFVERIFPGQNKAALAKVMLKASRPPKIDDILTIELQSQTARAQVKTREGRFATLELLTGDWFEVLESVGDIPLPPYMQRDADEHDKTRYQTVYAKEKGAVAAPTAGLHFDDVLLEKIRQKGVHIATVTLHVGAGTFLPIEVDDIQKHEMHAEWYDVSAETASLIQQTKDTGGRVIAVGTTSVRTLESAALKARDNAYHGLLKSCQDETKLFIYPGFEFQVVDALITNFHLPASTLMLLVSAFASREQILNAYQAAIDAEYRFFSYGDAMLIS